MNNTQKHLAWLFYIYGIVEVFVLVGLISVAINTQFPFNSLVEHSTHILFALFLIVNSMYMGNYLLKNPHLAKLPVGISYSLLSMIGYAWFRVAQGYLHNAPTVTVIVGAWHLGFAFAIGYLAEHLPKESVAAVAAPKAKAKRRK